jgi:hypothetical protein
MALKLSVNGISRRCLWPAAWQSILSLVAVASVLASTMPTENSRAAPMNVKLPQSLAARGVSPGT